MKTMMVVAVVTLVDVLGVPMLSGGGDLPELVDGNTDFALDLFGHLSQEKPNQNIFFSPFSISSALAMTCAGARGETESQMADVLHIDLPQSWVHPAFMELNEKLDPEYRASLAEDDAEPLVLEVANAIWVEASYPLLDGYLSLVHIYYGAEARNVDFGGNPEAQRQLINEWVSEKTRDKITDLLPFGSVNDLTRVILTNAIYFKGSWMDQFEESLTRSRDFTMLDGSVIRVPMMHRTDTFAYQDGYGCRAISLPYSDHMSSMLVLLPDGKLSEFERSFDRRTLEQVRENLLGTEVRLAMPSFEFTSSFSLGETLVELGMEDAFQEGGADFSGMTGNKELFVSNVIHEAFVKVDETGTEAAAATAVVMGGPTAAPPPPIELVLDRSFLFVIMDDLSGSVLFMGRLADPSS
ncbi:serpin family protein [Candidatus Fermentibacteria bacterium]|nr:serpin family protein [Candidatus Fermentibacteria bacterium]